MPYEKVAIFLDSPRKGNRRHHVQLKALKRAGLHPRVLFLSGDPSGSYLFYQGHQDTFLPLHLSREKAFRRFSWKALHKLVCTIRRENIKVVLTHRWRLLRYLILAKVFYPRFRIIYYIVIGGTLHSPGRRIFLKIFHSKIDRVLVNSRALLEEIQQKGFFPGHKLGLLYSAVDPREFETEISRSEARKLLGLPERDFLFGMVARFRKEKDHEGLLEAFFRFLGTGREARLVLAGDGPREARVRQRARDLQIDDRIHFLGRVPPSQVPQLLKALDVFVYPTFREGMPMAVMEAMAAGLPIIATQAEGLPDLFDTSADFGRLLPPGNPQILAQALCDLYDLEEKERQRMGKAARRRILEGFSEETLSRRTVEIFQELMRD